MITTVYGVQFAPGSKKQGLSHYLAGIAEKEEVLFHTNVPGMDFIPMGHELLNPIPLLSSERFQNLLDELAEQYDYVIVDAAPVGVVIDAAEIAKSCDGTLIAVQYNDVRRQELLDVKQQIEQSGCPILGTVLNQVDYDSYLSRKYYYRTYGKYGYYNRYYKHKHAAEKK